MSLLDINMQIVMCNTFKFLVIISKKEIWGGGKHQMSFFFLLFFFLVPIPKLPRCEILSIIIFSKSQLSSVESRPDWVRSNIP